MNSRERSRNSRLIRLSRMWWSYSAAIESNSASSHPKYPATVGDRGPRGGAESHLDDPSGRVEPAVDALLPVLLAKPAQDPSTALRIGDQPAPSGLLTFGQGDRSLAVPEDGDRPTARPILTDQP